MQMGQKIYQLRTDKNLSQGDLADRLGVSRQSVSKWETDAAVPDLDKLVRLCDLFGVTLDELTGREAAHILLTVKQTPSYHQILGIVLLAVALLGGILMGIFSDPVIAIFIALPILCCGITCLAVKKQVGYWCAWAGYLLITQFMAYTLRFISKPDCFEMFWGVYLLCPLFQIIMVLITARRLQDIPLPKKWNGIYISAGWLLYFLAIGATQFLPPIYPKYYNTNLFMNFNECFTLLLTAVFTYVFAALFVYTVCFFRQKLQTKK